MSNIDKNDEIYSNWLSEIKTKISVSQVKAALTVNQQLIDLYWEIGLQIVSKQQTANWGDKIISALAADLKKAFPKLKGFSERNLKYMKQFYSFYAQNQIGQRPVAQLQSVENKAADLKRPPALTQQLPWSHNINIFTKVNDFKEAEFYMQQTIVNNWSREVLALQIKSELHNRQGNAITNFDATLPAAQSELANETIKDPYIFDFMTLTQPFKEKDIEDQLVGQVSKFLLELGKGFAYMGRQYQLIVADQIYFLDLLFYHVTLKCYVVIELKNTKFVPEYAGKMNFYLSAVDHLIKSERDNATIGIMLCRDKNNIEVEFALRGLNNPIGVSEFAFTETVPNELKSSLPTIEEIENELDKHLKS